MNFSTLIEYMFLSVLLNLSTNPIQTRIRISNFIDLTTKNAPAILKMRRRKFNVAYLFTIYKSIQVA